MTSKRELDREAVISITLEVKRNWYSGGYMCNLKTARDSVMASEAGWSIHRDLVDELNDFLFHAMEEWTRTRHPEGSQDNQ